MKCANFDTSGYTHKLVKIHDSNLYHIAWIVRPASSSLFSKALILMYDCFYYSNVVTLVSYLLLLCKVRIHALCQYLVRFSYNNEMCAVFVLHAF